MLLKKLQNEHLIEYIYDILNLKDLIYLNQSLEKASELYSSCIYISKEDYNNQDDCIIYDSFGDELLVLSDGFVNQYSCEDYLVHKELFEELNKKIDNLINSELLIVLE